MTVLISIAEALVVRCCLILHVILCTWRVTLNLHREIYWLLLCILCPLLCESFYTIRMRHGREFSRFTPCIFFYLGAILPCIWLLEIDRTDDLLDGNRADSLDPDDIVIPGATRNIWLVVIEELMPYVICICRWILPRGKVPREELSDLLFTFISIASDVMEFFSLLDEVVIRLDKRLVYAVLSIWSLSVLQFTMTYTVIQQPRSENSPPVRSRIPEKLKEWKDKKHDIYVIMLILAMQDLPYAVIRLFTIIKFNLISYSLIFFTSKNILMIILLLYKVGVIYSQRYRPGLEEDEGGKRKGKRVNEDVERGDLRRDSLTGSLNLDDIFEIEPHTPHDVNVTDAELNNELDNMTITLDDNEETGEELNRESDGENELRLPKPQKQVEPDQNHTEILPTRHKNATPSTSNNISTADINPVSPDVPIIQPKKDSVIDFNDKFVKNRSLPEDSYIPAFNSESNRPWLFPSFKNHMNMAKSRLEDIPEDTNKDIENEASDNVSEGTPEDPPHQIFKKTPSQRRRDSPSPSESSMENEEMKVKPHFEQAHNGINNNTKPGIITKAPYITSIKF